MFKRIIIIVLDSVGIGELPDAPRYGDQGANTLVNTAIACGGLNVPILARLGLGCITPLAGVSCTPMPLAFYGKMAEASPGKDTTTGHWELAGAPITTPFPYYPQGFPADLIRKFTAATGYAVIGNKVASGTEIIAELGAMHMQTGALIVYTSADSVFQIAAHEEIVSLDELYRICSVAREQVLIGEHAVGRVIARPFIGEPGSFLRTANRHDYSLEPADRTMLDLLKAAGLSSIGIGKIGDIFAQRGLTASYPTKSNQQGMEVLGQLLEQSGSGVIMLNLVDFDSSYGHRRDAIGYARALTEFDQQLSRILTQFTATDLLLITADHGCDPTFKGSDHTREYVPLLAYNKQVNKGRSLGVRQTFADIAATTLDNFKLPQVGGGTSFLDELMR